MRKFYETSNIRTSRADMTKNKQCIKCEKRKLFSEFSKDKQRKDGLYPVCKKCKNNYDLVYRQLNKIKIKQCNKNYRNSLIGYLHTCFQNIKTRCTNPKHSMYKYYGGRGIECLFKNADEFVDCVINELQTDPRELQIDRINNNGNYESGNIRFVTAKENCNNRRKKSKCLKIIDK